MGYVSRVLVTFSSYLQPLFRFFSAFLFRLGKGVDSLEKSSDFSETFEEFETETETTNMFEEINGVVRSEDPAVEGVKENSDGFIFRFPTYEEFVNGERRIGVGCEIVDSEKGFSRFIVEPEVVESKVEQVDLFAVKDVFLEDEDTIALNKDSKQSHCDEGEDDSKKEKEDVENDLCSKEETEEVKNLGEQKSKFGDLDFFADETLFQSEKDSSFTDSDSASLTFEHMQSLMSRLVDSYSESFLSDEEDFGGDFKLDDLKENQEFDTFDQDDNNNTIMEEGLEEFKQDGNDSLETMESEFLSEKDFHEDSGKFEDWELDDSAVMEEFEAMESEFLSENDFREDDALESENVMLETESDLDLDDGDANKMESLWEHQDLLEQIKMELRKAKATGLPTIFEESECPKMDDLKPWKIDERFQHQDCIGELMKFNKSYRERMRKLDIFTYQKLYAIGTYLVPQLCSKRRFSSQPEVMLGTKIATSGITKGPKMNMLITEGLGFLQKDPSKDPFQLISSHKSSGPALKSSLIKNIWPFKQKSSEIDPVAKFIKEIQCELEVVYVGQMCLSWEFLHWQYGKALDLWDSDPRGTHRYNEVAGEFQQFQVLLQRFIEDEHFQGPRLQYYIKSRYDYRNLLQVPVIREDNLKDRKKAVKFEKGDFAITSDILVEILEECIRIFWRFVKGDNDSSTVPVKSHKGVVHPEIENAGDLELLMEVRRSLQKKERKLRDTLRSENCVLRRFKRCRDKDDSDDHVLYFFSQVDMKLVSRVLNMSRLRTEQLVWCHNKLSRIRLVNRKIHVDPSFLLFPC